MFFSAFGWQNLPRRVFLFSLWLVTYLLQKGKLDFQIKNSNQT